MAKKKQTDKDASLLTATDTQEQFKSFALDDLRASNKSLRALKEELDKLGLS
ncbi:MAG TPA: hypothetical protein VEW94_08655 [Chloroflexia bacterium]|nr:hypothetical protein [Chloroflexia bacterium]